MYELYAVVQVWQVTDFVMFGFVLLWQLTIIVVHRVIFEVGASGGSRESGGMVHGHVQSTEGGTSPAPFK